ncbi:hypothetical protein PWY87_08345 [Kribbella solani]|uniref:hypothetical protein n=1 Tax=Kribbella solani TaxID=236067 RepID=UPI0029BB3B81|nr:hypothetical protein [Kribbella solani]MDX2972505.1 hypothetical protein [Kribbella solani]MDX3001671.1 hypothetical protein [Kribbella solani]
MTPRATPSIDALRAELLKLSTLPAIGYTVVGTWALTALLTVAFVNAGQDGADALSGAVPAGFVVLGLLPITSEYQGGQIRTTLLAVPRRITTYGAKLVALLLVTLPVAGTTVAITALIDGPADLRAIGYLTATTIIAHATGTLLRKTVPALVSLLTYYFILGPLLQAHTSLTTYLPDSTNWLTLSTWAAGLTTLAILTFHSRDA